MSNPGKPYLNGHPTRVSMRARVEISRRIDLYRANTPRKIAADFGISARRVYQIVDGIKLKEKKNAPTPSGGTTHKGYPQPLHSRP